MTVVESGTRALEYLGLDGQEKSPIGLEVSILFIYLFSFVCWIYISVYCIYGVVEWFWSQSVKVNLIMTDYSMPGMTGYELLKKIKVDNKFSSFFTFFLCFFLREIVYWYFLFLFLFYFSYQESSIFREIPVVIMSSENILTRIDRYALLQLTSLVVTCDFAIHYISLILLEILIFFCEKPVLCTNFLLKIWTINY